MPRAGPGTEFLHPLRTGGGKTRVSEMIDHTTTIEEIIGREMSADLSLRKCYLGTAPGAGAGDESWFLDTRGGEEARQPPHCPDFVCTDRAAAERAIEKLQKIERGEGASLREILVLADRRTGWGLPVRGDSPSAAAILIVEGPELDAEIARGKVLWPENIPF